MNEIRLTCADGTIGDLVFLPSGWPLQASRTADGLKLVLPAKADLRRLERAGTPIGYLTDVHVTLSHNDVELGLGVDPGFYATAGLNRIDVNIRLTATALAVLERTRNGGRVVLQLHVKARCGLVVRRDSSEHLTMPSVVSQVVKHSVDRDDWVDLLRQGGWGDSVLLEVPLPSQPEPAWDEVWKAVRLAREALDRGGPTGWKACVLECRHALDKWGKLQGVANTNGTKPRELTRVQRFDRIREAVHGYANDPIHSSADETTRAEAVMVFGALIGLLGVRST